MTIKQLIQIQKLPRKKLINLLVKMLKFYERTEQFETCAIINEVDVSDDVKISLVIQRFWNKSFDEYLK